MTPILRHIIARHAVIDARMVEAVAKKLGVATEAVTLVYRRDAQTGAKIADDLYGGMTIPVFRVPTAAVEIAKSYGLTVDDAR